MNIFSKFAVKTLQKNRSRTLVTIIGIILSASMLTAVTTLVTSGQNFLVTTATAISGDWHGAVFDLNEDEHTAIRSNKDLTRTVSVQNIGYARLDGSANESKPYLFVAGIQSNFTEHLPVHLLSGRMPQAEGEILLPKHMETNGKVKYALGETITLPLGERYFDGQRLWQYNSYEKMLDDDDNVIDEESLIPSSTKTYTVVGIYERPTFEPYSAPGYTALTYWENDFSGNYDAYVQHKNARSIVSFIEDQDNPADLNCDYLRAIGASGEDSFEKVLYGLGAILMGLIMFASISLIYNAFAISVSERKKQFGLISSIGATKKQITRSVLFEALVLSGIGIPAGILCGIGGIAVTLKALSKSLTAILGDIFEKGGEFTLKVTPATVLVAAAVGIVTVLISAYLPARKALKRTSIDAIRQSEDIAIKTKSVKTSPLVYKLFGFEGMIASKNFKRNKKRYRATVVSLFMSIVLFISASSFCAYLGKGVNSVVDNKSFDMGYDHYDFSELPENSFLPLYNEMKEVSGITKSGYAAYTMLNFDLERPLISQRYLDAFIPESDNDGEIYSARLQLFFVDDASYKQYLNENGLDEAVYMNATAPKGVTVDLISIFSMSEEKYKVYNVFDQNSFQMEAYAENAIEDYYYSGFSQRDANGEKQYRFRKSSADENDPGAERLIPEREAVTKTVLDIGTVAQTAAYGADSAYSNTVLVTYPYSAMQTVLPDNEYPLPHSMFFNSSNNIDVQDKLLAILDESTYGTGHFYNYAEDAMINRAMVTIVNVFSYGFIVLISLIAATNVFNTISTNINLRRREFAMLKSVGMTRSGFNKMMNYECLLYGLKGLLYGLPVSFLVTYLIFKVLMTGVDLQFFIPLNSVIIAIVSVFLVVFATMLYSMNKIKKENTIDALKNENY